MILRAPLIILAVCGNAFAQGGGDKYVSASLKMLLTVNTIECDLRTETFVNGKTYTARGRYEEQALVRTAPGQSPPFLRSMYRLDIYCSMNAPMASDSEANRMTLVCRPETNGGRGLVERRISIEGNTSLSMIDLARVEDRLKETNRELFFSQVSEVCNLGGLAGMMRQISRFYEFSPHSQENLQDEETIPALKLTGQLRSMHHKEWLQQFGGLDTQGNYPADFPGEIEIWIGRHNDFPYKIRYLRRISEKSEQRELLFQELFFNVRLGGAPILESKFAPLSSPGAFMQDETDDFLRELGL